MNKTAIKNFAIWARNKLIADVSYDARLIGITEDGIAKPLPQSFGGTQFFDIGTAEPYSISGEAVRQRDKLIEVIQQLGEGVVGAAGDRGSVLGHGEIGKVRRSALTLQQLREKAALLHLLLPCVEGLPQGVGVGAAGVRLAAGAADQLPCQQGRNGGEGVHEPAVQRTVLRAPGQQAAEGILLRRQRVALILTGRQVVVKPRQHLTLLGHLEVHPAQAVHDAALPIHQNEVGVAGHGL